MTDEIDLKGLKSRLIAHGAVRLLVKELAPNDNSKNQPYFAKGTLDVANILPMGATYVDISEDGNPILKAPLAFEWLRADGATVIAPAAKLIFYPQYPEVRFSGFLQGVKDAPSALMNTREAGRLLFLGVTADRRVIGFVCARDAPLAISYRSLSDLESDGVFKVIPLQETGSSSLSRLLTRMAHVYSKDWIDSKSLKPDGSLVPCRSTQCVGYTLEAELGIARNGRAEPDFEGWEIKASKVTSFKSRSQSHRLTLMTPEPTGGRYRDHGMVQFIRDYGYYAHGESSDRMNFVGIHRVGVAGRRSGLTMKLTGYDPAARVISDPSGALQLVTAKGEVAAEWSYTALLDLWSRKHNKALYAMAEMRLLPDQQYRYSSQVFLGTGTDFNFFVSALADGDVFYDPGMKVENVSSGRPKGKPRSQFRVTAGKLAQLYKDFRALSLV